MSIMGLAASTSAPRAWALARMIQPAQVRVWTVTWLTPRTVLPSAVGSVIERCRRGRCVVARLPTTRVMPEKGSMTSCTSLKGS